MNASQTTSSTSGNPESTAATPANPRRHPPEAPQAAADKAAPRLIPVAYTPVANAGRSGHASFTAAGINDPPTATPIPTGTVSKITTTAEGTNARATPNTPINTNASRDRPTAHQPAGQTHTHRRKQPHTQHHDCRQQPRHRMRHTQPPLNRRQQRPNRNDLRPQTQRRSKQPRQQQMMLSPPHHQPQTLLTTPSCTYLPTASNDRHVKQRLHRRWLATGRRPARLRGPAQRLPNAGMGRTGLEPCSTVLPHFGDGDRLSS